MSVFMVEYFLDNDFKLSIQNSYGPYSEDLMLSVVLTKRELRDNRWHFFHFDTLFRQSVNSVECLSLMSQAELALIIYDFINKTFSKLKDNVIEDMCNESRVDLSKLIGNEPKPLYSEQIAGILNKEIADRLCKSILANDFSDFIQIAISEKERSDLERLVKPIKSRSKKARSL